VACEVLKNVLELWIKSLQKKGNKSKYRHKGTRKTTVKTLMGEVAFSRVVYESTDDEGNNTYIYLLDQLLGFDTIG
jgi:hypothetical protein